MILNRVLPKMIGSLSLLSVALVCCTGMNAGQPENTAMATIKSFCELDAKGAQLDSTRGRSEIAKLLLTHSPLSSNQEISVIKDYAIYVSRTSTDHVYFTIKYRELGRISPTGVFTRIQGLAAGVPVTSSQYIRLNLGDKYNEIGSDGRMVSVNGERRWRIESTPPSPHVYAETALRYLEAIKGKAGSNEAEMNVERSIQYLASLASDNMQSDEITPTKFVEEFCKLDSAGEQLNPSGARAVSELFVDQTDKLPSKAIVVRSFTVGNSFIDVSKNAQVKVEYLSFGTLDLQSARLVEVSLSGSKVFANYDLIFQDNAAKSVTGLSDKTVSQGVWKIKGAPPLPHLEIDSALRLVKRIRDGSGDGTMRANAEKTIEILERGRP